MSCKNFNGIECLQCVDCNNTSWLYIIVGLVQIIVLVLQIWGISLELDKCEYDGTYTERVIANWAAWLNGISLLLCSLWSSLKMKSCCGNCRCDFGTNLFEWVIKILWIGTTLVSVIFSAITTGHMLHIDDICEDANGNTLIDAKTVLDTSTAILVLWFALLALGHMGAKKEKNMNVAQAVVAAAVRSDQRPESPPEMENGERKLYFRGNKYDTIKF